MKKITLLAMLMIMLICGCKSARERETLGVNLRSITFKADIAYYNENYSCDCTINKDGDFKVLITAPENLNGLSLCFSGDDLMIEYNGIEINGAQRFLPQNVSIKLLNDVLRFCGNADYADDGHNLTVDGEVDGNKFTLKVSPSGLPISLEIPDSGMSVTFKDVSIINNKNGTEEN